jgi:acetyltransferase-like isoleucine patch superfamily enzyme
VSRLAEYLRRPGIWKYQAMSTCPRVSGSPFRWQPVLFLGPGAILIGDDVEFGWPTAQDFRHGYSQLEAVTPEATITIGDHVRISNNAFLKSEGPGITIGPHGLLGSRVCIYDTDFHDLDPRRRRGGTPLMGAVELEENVFIGDRVLILKGVRIGKDSVIGAGSVVTRSIPAGVVAAGNPARVVRELPAPQERGEPPVAALRGVSGPVQ